jgi:DNA polymerase V
MNPHPFDRLPLVQAGFPSPANDYLHPDLDFNAYFNTNRVSVVPVRVKGDCMKDAFIPHNSIVIVDRCIRTPPNNSIVIATVNGENMIKHLITTRDGSFLLPANKKYKSIRLTEEMDFSIWGTARHVIIDL